MMYSYFLIDDINSLVLQASKVTGTANKTSIQVLPQPTITAFTKRVSWFKNSIGRTTIHSISNFVIDGGSIMNGRTANIGDKSRQRRKQNNRTPIGVESGSLDQNVCTVWYHFLWVATWLDRLLISCCRLEVYRKAQKTQPPFARWTTSMLAQAPSLQTATWVKTSS
jgi:hypothetical protein